MAQNSSALSEKDKKYREFALTGNLWAVIFQVGFPLAAFQLFHSTFNILDTLMASHVSSIAVSAVAYLSQIQSMIAAFGSGLAAGSTLKISEAYGAGDYKLVKERLSTLITICAAISLAVFLCIPITPAILKGLGTPDEFILVGSKYFSVTLLSTGLGFFNTVYIALERARGNSKRILLLNSIVIILKGALTAIFIYGFNGDVTMIAVASVIAQVFLFTMSCLNLFRGDNAFTFSMLSVNFKKKVVVPMLTISFPVIVEKIAFAFGKTVVNSMSKNYGPTTVGALGISNNTNGLITSTQNGFQDGGAAIISQNLGAGNKKRALGTFYRLLVINVGVGLIGFILLNVFLEPISFFFANSSEGYDEGFRDMIITVTRFEALGGSMFLGVNASVMALFFGFGETKLTLLSNFCRVFVFRIPVLWALQNFTALGSESVGIVMGVSNALTALFSSIIAIFVVRRIKRSIKEEENL